MIEREKKV